MHLPFALLQALRLSPPSTSKTPRRRLRALSGRLLLGVTLALAACVGDDNGDSETDATTGGSSGTTTTGSTGGESASSSGSTSGGATEATDSSGSASDSDSSTSDATSTSDSTAGESTGETGDSTTGSTTGGVGSLEEACSAVCALFDECDSEEFPGIDECVDECSITWANDEDACEDAGIVFLGCLGSGTCEDLDSDLFCGLEYNAVVAACAP